MRSFYTLDAARELAWTQTIENTIGVAVGITIDIM